MEIYLLVLGVVATSGAALAKPAERISPRNTNPYPPPLPPPPPPPTRSPYLWNQPGFLPNQFDSSNAARRPTDGSLLAERVHFKASPPPPPPPPPILPPLDFWDLPGFLPSQLDSLNAARHATYSPPSAKGVHFNASPPPPPPPPPPTLSPLDIRDLPGLLPNQLESLNAAWHPTDSPPPAEGVHFNPMGPLHTGVDESVSIQKSPPQHTAWAPTSPDKDWIKLIEPFIYWSTIAAVNSVLQNIPQLKMEPQKLIQPSSGPETVPITVDHEGVVSPPELNQSSDQPSHSEDDYETNEEYFTENEPIKSSEHKESETSNTEHNAQEMSEETNIEGEGDNEYNDYKDSVVHDEKIELHNDKTNNPIYSFDSVIKHKESENPYTEHNSQQTSEETSIEGESDHEYEEYEESGAHEEEIKSKNDKANDQSFQSDRIIKYQEIETSHTEQNSEPKSKETNIERESDHEYEEQEESRALESNNDETNDRNYQSDQIIGQLDPSIIDNHKVNQARKPTQSSNKLQPEDRKYDTQRPTTKGKQALIEVKKYEIPKISKPVLKNSIDNKKIINLILFYPNTGSTDQNQHTLKDGSTTFTIDIRESDIGKKEREAAASTQSKVEKIHAQEKEKYIGKKEEKSTNNRLTSSQSNDENIPKPKEETYLVKDENNIANIQLRSSYSKAKNIPKEEDKTNGSLVQSSTKNEIQVELNQRTDNSKSNIQTSFLVENLTDLKTNEVTTAKIELENKNKGMERVVTKEVNDDFKEMKLETNSTTFTNIKAESTDNKNTGQLQKPESTKNNVDADFIHSVIEANKTDQMGEDDKNINIVVMENKNQVTASSEHLHKEPNIVGEVELNKSMNQQSYDTGNQTDVTLKTNKVTVPTIEFKNENEGMERVVTKEVNDDFKENKFETNSTTFTNIMAESTDNKNTGQLQKPESTKNNVDADLIYSNIESNKTDQIGKDDKNIDMVVMENENQVNASSEHLHKEPNIVGEVELNKSIIQQSNDTGNQTDVTLKTNKVTVPTIKIKNENEGMKRVVTKEVNEDLKENKFETNPSSFSNINEDTENKNTEHLQNSESTEKNVDVDLIDSVIEANKTDQMDSDNITLKMALTTVMDKQNISTTNTEPSDKEPKMVGDVELNKLINQQSNVTSNQEDVTITSVEEKPETHFEATVTRK